MSTNNVSVSTEWTQLATPLDTDLHISWGGPATVEFAVTDTDSTPTVSGHYFLSNSKLSRGDLGNGYLWSRKVKQGNDAGVTLCVTKGRSSLSPTPGYIAYSPDDINTVNDVLTKYTYTGAPGHHLRFQRTVNGQAIISLVADPNALDSLSYLDYQVGGKIPMALEVEASMPVRTRMVHAGILLGNYADPLEPQVASVAVTQWWKHNTDYSSNYVSASGPYLTMVLSSPLPNEVYLGDWISVTGINDGTTQGYSIVEVANAPIRHINDDRTRITVSYTDEVISASHDLSTKNPSAGTMFIHFFDNMLGATHGMGMRFSSSSVTNAACFTKMGGDAFMSSSSGNDFRNDQRVTISSTASQNIIGTSGVSEIRATSRFRMETRVDECSFQDQLADVANIQVNRLTRSSVKPNSDLTLYPRAYVRVPQTSTTVAARIASVSKIASSTVTVTTLEKHGLKTGDIISLRGVVDQTNFAASSTAVAVTVTGLNTFTVVWGISATASSYGGVVARHINGGTIDLPNIVVGEVIYANWGNTTQVLKLTSSVNWGGASVGDVVFLRGCLASGGVDTTLDGGWRVHNITSTVMYLTPISDVYGNRITPNPIAFAGAAGGKLQMAVELRLHDLSIEEWSEHRVIVDGAGTSRQDKALPAYIVGGSSSVSPFTTLNSTNGTGAVHVRGAVIGLLDIASAAVTSTNTSSAIYNDLGNGFQVNVAVSAVSGTSPTMDLRIEESFDGGTNWVTLYEFQRITATGSYNSPVLRATGRHVRYVRSLAGTSPSFTMALTRNVLPFMPSEPQKRLIDRTLVPNTLNSVTPILFMGEANNVQLVVNMATITTTAPVIKLQGSEDSQNWFDIDAVGLTAVANSTVEKTINAKACTYIRAQVTTAGVGATLGYIALKAWS